MIYSHFIARLILCLIAGLLFIAALRHLAISNPDKELPANNKYRWIGIVFYSLCVIQLIAFIYFFSQIQYPLTTAEPIIPRDGIVRNSSVHIVWGYATPMQSFAFTFFIGIFACFGFAQYFLKFKPSPSKWWAKVLKFIGYVIVWMLYVNSTDFHYFDTTEWIKAGLYIFSLWICFAPSSKPKGKKDRVDKSAPDTISEDILPPPIPEVKQEHITSSVTNENVEKEDVVPTEIIETISTTDTVVDSVTTVVPDNDNVRFCRYCGHQIEADSKFCKYCGKPTGTRVSPVNSYFTQGLNYCKFYLNKIHMPKFNFKKSETNNPRLLKWLKYMASICLLLGLIGIALCVIYFNHSWNYDGFQCYGVQDKFSLFLGFSIAIVIFGLLTWLFAFWHKKTKFLFVNTATMCLAILTYLASLGNIVSTVVSISKFQKYYYSIEMDNALVDPSSSLYQESIDKFNATLYENSFNCSYDNRFTILRNLAEAGNAHSQYLLGKYYYELRDWDPDARRYSIPHYDRALYWFTKSADNGFAKGQRKLGEFYLGKISDQYFDIPLATQYLEKAVAQNDPRSFYLIGLVYANSDNDRARKYWEKGASLGDEACKQCLESFSIPEEAIQYGYEETDTIAPY